MILTYKVKTFVKTHSCISVHPLDESVRTKVKTFLIDNELSFIVELKDVTKENSNEAIGLATNSNSESTVLSYASNLTHISYHQITDNLVIS
jgi:hypothetical protein